MTEPADQTDALFISEQPLWPMDQGYRVHGCQMARALAQTGVRVKMASLRPTTGCDQAWLNDMLVDWPGTEAGDHEQFIQGWSGPGAKLRHKIARHQALDTGELAGLIPLVRRLKPKAVVALGQHGPIMLRGLQHAYPDIATIWYAADEPVSFQLSCLRREGITSLKKRVYLAGLYAGLQTFFARGLDGAIGVSPGDTRLLKRVAGVRQAVNIPNGVDTEYFDTTAARRRPGSLVFWGRLDFEPNQDALCWFARRVWPRLLERQPQAQLKIVGKNANDKVRALGETPGIEFVGEVDDIRPYAHAASATILPMRLGGGIKNKLLEAAAMGLPILASHKAVKGLNWPAHTTPVQLCRGPDDWVHQIERVWYDGLLAETLRREARAWVCAQHTWPAAARSLTQFIEGIIGSPLNSRHSNNAGTTTSVVASNTEGQLAA
jgi:glycosyltransferase involved in cell wall biosynthesis